MHMDERGVGVMAEGALDTSQETVDRAKDLIIVMLDRRGLSLMEIGRVINMPKSTVHYRLKTIPPEAREHYEKQIRRLAGA